VRWVKLTSFDDYQDKPGPALGARYISGEAYRVASLARPGDYTPEVINLPWL
jgi:hypothetical protein